MDPTSRERLDGNLEGQSETAHLPDDLERTLRRFYDAASVMMGTVEIVGSDILHISDNRATAHAFGTTLAAMWGCSASSLGVPEQYVAIWLEAYRRSARSDEPVRFDYQHEGTA